MIVAVFTLKYFRQSRQRYGIFACLQSCVFRLPQPGQSRSPVGQTKDSNHLRAFSSSANRSASSSRLIPFL